MVGAPHRSEALILLLAWVDTIVLQTLWSPALVWPGFSSLPCRSQGLSSTPCPCSHQSPVLSFITFMSAHCLEVLTVFKPLELSGDTQN